MLPTLNIFVRLYPFFDEIYIWSKYSDCNDDVCNGTTAGA